MPWISVDVEADGPVPGLYSMVSFGAVLLDKERKLEHTFYGKTAPITEQYQPDALAISGHTREEHLWFPEPENTMRAFHLWLTLIKESKGSPLIFCTDNLAFDWTFINYYLHRYAGDNPFGWSGRRINDLWAGMHKNTFARFKHLRKTPHTHHPVDDAKGNAEIVYLMIDDGLKLKL